MTKIDLGIESNYKDNNNSFTIKPPPPKPIIKNIDLIDDKINDNDKDKEKDESKHIIVYIFSCFNNCYKI
jgi:hypothetical protein